MSTPRKDNKEPAPSRRSGRRSSGDGALLSFADPEALLKKPKGGQKTAPTTEPVLEAPPVIATPVVDTTQEVKTTPVVNTTQEVETTPVVDTTQEVKTTPIVETTIAIPAIPPPVIPEPAILPPPRPVQAPPRNLVSMNLMEGFSLARRTDSTLTLKEYVRIQKLERAKREQEEEEALIGSAVSNSADGTAPDGTAASNCDPTTSATTDDATKETAADSTTDGAKTEALFGDAASKPIINAMTNEAAASNSTSTTVTPPTITTATPTTTTVTPATVATTVATTAGNNASDNKPECSEDAASKSTPASNEEDQTTKKSGRSILELFDKGDLDAIRDRVEFSSRRQQQQLNTKQTTSHNEPAPAATSSTGSNEKSTEPPKRKASSLFGNRPASNPVVKRIKVIVPPPKGAAKDPPKGNDEGSAKGKGKGKGKAVESDNTTKKLPRSKKNKAAQGRKKRKQRTAEEKASIDLSLKRYQEEKQRNARAMWTSRNAENYIFFYSANRKYGWLSQWWSVTGFQLKGKSYDCAEQYMMYQKALLFKDKDPDNILLAGRIMEEKSQRMIRLMGHQVKGLDQNIWEENRERIVREGNLAKFMCSEPMKWALLSTRNKIIVEAAPSDTVWGIRKSKEEAARLLPNAQFEFGLNLLGRQLMIVREVIRKVYVFNTDHSEHINSLEKRAQELDEHAAESELAAEDGPAAEDNVVMADGSDSEEEEEEEEEADTEDDKDTPNKDALNRDALNRDALNGDAPNKDAHDDSSGKNSE
ncbi:hypothetical protein F4679DRAFT_593276 [Xylaria curta]|nr:hypothetical protein F4679DRAFT_593276 [Xylaria curta]